MTASNNSIGLSSLQVIRVLMAPLAFAANLVICYSLVHHACSTGHDFALHAISALAFLICLAGAIHSWRQYQQARDANDEGDTPVDHTKFLAMAGFLSSLAFAIVIFANAVPQIILSPCD